MGICNHKVQFDSLQFIDIDRDNNDLRIDRIRADPPAKLGEQPVKPFSRQEVGRARKVDVTTRRFPFQQIVSNSCKDASALVIERI